MTADPAGTAPPAVSGTLVPVLEIGGTHVSAALVDPDAGRVAVSHREDLDATGTAAAIVAALTGAGRRLGRHPRWGVAIPGPFDYRNGIGRFAHVAKFESLDGFDLGRALSAGLGGAPAVSFVNDADAFGIGEAVAGAARGHRRALCLTLGTGIGSAFISDGVPVNDGPDVPPDGSVHLLQWDGAPIEETVSRRALRRRYRALTGADLDVHEIAELARSHDAAAGRTFTDCFTALGSCLAPWIRRFGATTLVLGGSIAGSFDLVEGPLQLGIRAADPLQRIAARPAAHPHTSALFGAAQATREPQEATGLGR